MVLASLAVPGTPAACAGRGNRVDLVGSDTMIHLAQLWAEAFHARYPGISVPVSGGGSGVGIAALLNGYAGVALASRRASPAEWRAARERGIALSEQVVGWDGLALIVHPTNPIPSLTLAEVRNLFTGRTARWPDGRPVVVVSREVNSGTYLFMRQVVLGGAGFAPGALKLPSTQQVRDTVARTPGAIGYVGLGYLGPGVRAVPVVPGPGLGPVAPDPAAVAAGRYPLRRPLYLYAAQPDHPARSRFVRWALGPEGQRLVRAAGFVPVRPGAAGGEGR